MKWFGTSFLIISLALGLGLGACNSTRPSSPARVVSLNVTVPSSNELRASLLTAASNELLYRVDGPGMATIKGTLGPFVSLAATGSIDFVLDIPTGPKRVLSLQLNDASTHQPLALGAAGIDFSGSFPVSELVVDMGSVTRTCYYTNGNYFAYGYSYGFQNDNGVIGQTNGPTYDENFNYVSIPGHPAPVNGSGFYYFMEDASANTNTASVAYMGNGNLVDFDYVPPDSQFYQSSMVAKSVAGAPVSDLQIGDIYCVKLNTISAGHAWLQFTNQNTFPNSPSFIFRVNSSLPYYAYDRTSADTANTCSTNW